jgi:hypothetical protein
MVLIKGMNLAVKDVFIGPKTLANIERNRKPEEEYSAHLRAILGGCDACKRLHIAVYFIY